MAYLNLGQDVANIEKENKTTAQIVAQSCPL